MNADEDLSTGIPDSTNLRESVTDDVRAAFDHHTADVADKLANSTEETAAERTERLRNERGQFVKQDKVETQTAAPDKTTDADRPAEQAASPSTANGPPSSWSAGAKTEWSKIPPSVQAEVIRRESEINEGGRQWSEQKRNYEQALSPVAALAQEYQMPVGDAIQRLVNVERRIADPRQASTVIRELAQAYHVDLAALINGSQQPASGAPPTFDPNQFFQTVDQRLEQRLNEHEQERQRAAETQGIITSFESEKDANGKLVHEHFDSVKVLMGNLLKSGQASDMQDAYDKAIWATPETRAKLIAAQTAAVPDRARVDKAKRAAVSLNGAPRGTPINRQVNGSAGSVMDDVRAAVAAHSGNG